MLCFTKPMELYVILLLSISLLCLQPIATAPTNKTDRLALLKFKESIGNDPFNIFSSWNDSTHFCNWRGITCGHKHQRVVALDLENYTLSGSISPYVGNLSFLRRINLRNNSFHDEIPQEITHLFRLQHLALENNLLTGQIPKNFTNSPELKYIALGGNKITGTIPVELGSLKKLERLFMGTNNLTGGIPPSIGNASSLERLEFPYNSLVGTIPDEIGNLQRLRYFAAAANHLIGMFPYSLLNISTLLRIGVAGNQLHGTLPANIGLAFPNLEFFSAANNKFSGAIPISICNASLLTVLELSHNYIVGQVPTCLGNLLNLRSLGIYGNNLGSDSPKELDFLTSLGNCTKLERLGFGNNNFGGSLPDSIGNLSKQLKFLNLEGNQMSGNIPESLEDLQNLSLLSMARNLFVGNVPTYVGKFQKLEALYLSANKLSGKIPSSIGNLTRLVVLFLSQNKLEGSIPSSLENCKGLQVLYIGENNLHGSIPVTILSSQLLEFNLSQNLITGILPMEVGNSKNMYLLDVSENNLSGEIPRTIGDCLFLQDLFLQGNSFQGILPTSLASLKDLYHLNLSRNNLSGLIPKDLEKLPLLYLNISFNNLEGEVPTKGIFSNASGISVFGNKKLCGGIPMLQLPACNNRVPKREKSKAVKLVAIIICGVLCLVISSFFLALYRRKKLGSKSSPTLLEIDAMPKVSYRELHQVTGGFSQNNLIGSGSFGSVYKGILDPQERRIAVKVLNLQKRGASKSFVAECNVLRNIRHRNLVKVRTCCSSVDYNGNEFKALVFDFMENGSLEKWLHPNGENEDQSRKLDLLQRLNIGIDVASALHYLHDHCNPPIIHCDLKPSNVLLDKEMIAHVSDFGLAKLLSPTNDVSQNESSTMGIKGSIGYIAPEYGMGGEASAEGDVYSYGIFILEMFTGKRPIDKRFQDDFDLHNFVKMALPERLGQIVDLKLLNGEATEIAMATEEDNYNRVEQDEIEVEEERSYIGNLNQMNAKMQECLLSVFNIGLACSLESPKERLTMGHIVKELHHIRNAFLGIGIHG